VITPRATPALAVCSIIALAASPARAKPAAAPLVSVAATPSQVTISGGGAKTIVLANRGPAPVAVDISAADFTFDRLGRAEIGPRTASPRSARTWLTVRPRLRTIAPGATADVRVSAHTPRGAEPGDHHALVLLTTRPVRRGPVAIRTRVGVLVLVRVSGKIVRRLDVGGVSAVRTGSSRLLQILVANRGNVTERLLPRAVSVSLIRAGRTVATLPALPRDLLPRTSGRLLVPYRGRLRGPVRAAVHVRPLRASLDGPGAPELRPFVRVFGLRL